MKFKTFPLMGTWLFALIFLGATLWHSVSRDGWGFLISGLLFLSFVVFACVVIGEALTQRTKIAGYRCLISIVALGLFIPTLILGGKLRNEIFLFELPTYQKITDILISQKQIKANDPVVPFPAGYTSELIDDRYASVRRDDSSITVLYLTRDSSAIGHAGFMYRSDDDPTPLKKQDPEMGFRRIAPHWFTWGS